MEQGAGSREQGAGSRERGAWGMGHGARRNVERSSLFVLKGLEPLAGG